MADVVDQAQDWTERWQASLLQSRLQASGRGSDVCRACGAAIPAARRRAVPGADRCVECQRGQERQCC